MSATHHVEAGRLGNGARVLLIQRDSGLTAIHALLRAGSLSDPPGQEGISHCLEHMLFKGTVNTPGVALSERFTLLGALPQAETTPDETSFSLLVPARNAGPALGALAEMLAEPELHPAAVAVERDVIRGEIRGNRDDLRWWLVSELLPQQLFPGVRAGYPITGTPESVAGFTRARLVAHFRRVCHGGNLVLAVCGPQPPEQVLPLVEAAFGRLPPGPPAPLVPLAPTGAYGRAEAHRHTDLAAVALGWRLPVVPAGVLPALDLSVSVLGEGTQSMLFSALRAQRGVAYDASAFRRRSLLADFVAVQAQVDPGSVVTTVGLIRELVAAIGRDVDVSALVAVRALAETAALEGAESASNLASWYAVQAARGRPLESPVERAAALRRVTAGAVADAARTYLDPGRYAYAAVVPEGR